METQRPSLVRPLVVWLLVQLAALAIGAGGLPLSANAPRPPETLAVQVILVTQVAAAAALWPLLFGEWRRSLTVIATSVPFVQAAGFLSAVPTTRLVPACGFLLMWLGSLAALPGLRRELVWRRLTHALLILVSIGGAIVTYFRAEFSPEPARALAAGPVVWPLQELTGFSGTFSWILAGMVFIVCLLARFVSRRALVRHAGESQ